LSVAQPGSECFYRSSAKGIAAEPYASKIIKERMSPGKLYERARKNVTDLSDFDQSEIQNLTGSDGQSIRNDLCFISEADKTLQRIKDYIDRPARLQTNAMGKRSMARSRRLRGRHVISVIEPIIGPSAISTAAAWTYSLTHQLIQRCLSGQPDTKCLGDP